MNFDWLAWSNPVAIWWCFLLIVSATNIALWFLLHRRFRQWSPRARRGILRVEILVLLCAAYVFGCAFRSVLPRADVQRISLFDTWLSSVLVGRSVATIAELCFVLQWAIVLHQLAHMAKADTARNIAKVIVPLILLAELCSWVRGDHDQLPWQHVRKFIMGGDVPADRGGPAATYEQFPRPCPPCTRIGGRRDYRLSGLPGEGRRPDVFRAMASRCSKRQGAVRSARRPTRSRHALDRHARHRAMEGRNCLDVALFQSGGMVEPGAGRLWSGQAPVAAISPATGKREHGEPATQPARWA